MTCWRSKGPNHQKMSKMICLRHHTDGYFWLESWAVNPARCSGPNQDPNAGPLFLLLRLKRREHTRIPSTKPVFESVKWGHGPNKSSFLIRFLCLKHVASQSQGEDEVQTTGGSFLPSNCWQLSARTTPWCKGVALQSLASYSEAWPTPQNWGVSDEN